MIYCPNGGRGWRGGEGGGTGHGGGVGGWVGGGRWNGGGKQGRERRGSACSDFGGSINYSTVNFEG